MGKQIGIKLDGASFNSNGENLTLDEFLNKIESVGLEFGGKVSLVDDEGSEIEGINSIKD